MRHCRKCNTQLIEGNHYPSMIKNGDYRCKPCTRSYNNTITKPKWSNKIKGVYGIFSNDECLYVGESSQLNSRMSQHKTYIRNPLSAKPFFQQMYISIAKRDNVQVRILEETNKHKEQEHYWINKLRPLYNDMYHQ